MAACSRYNLTHLSLKAVCVIFLFFLKETKYKIQMWDGKTETLSTLLMTDRLAGGCPDGVSCDYAHSPEELQEWTERRDFLRQKLARAREDMLIMPDEFDFGKYNFLLHNWERRRKNSLFGFVSHFLLQPLTTAKLSSTTSMQNTQQGQRHSRHKHS